MTVPVSMPTRMLRSVPCWAPKRSTIFAISTENGVFLTQRVVDKIPDTLPYTDSGVVETSTGWQRVWRVDPSATEI